MRLIDADKLQKEFQQKLKYCMEWKKKSTENESRADAEMAMLEECIIAIDCQSLIDAVPVVRCKDCVYAKPFNAIWRLPKKDTLICTLNNGAEVTENDFCSFGRRKNDSN